MRTWQRVAFLALALVVSTAARAADEEPLEVRDYQIDGLIAVVEEMDLERLGLGWAPFGYDEEDCPERRILGMNHAQVGALIADRR